MEGRNMDRWRQTRVTEYTEGNQEVTEAADHVRPFVVLRGLCVPSVTSVSHKSLLFRVS